MISERSKRAKKTDRRILKTRKALFDAFDRLACVKDYDKITISELAREADIDRKTFYLHYASIDEMVDDKVDGIVARILDEVEEDMQRRVEAGEQPAPAPDPRVFFAGVSRAVRTYLPMREHTFGAMPASVLADRLARPLTDEIKRRGLVRLDVEDDVLDICVASLTGGIIGAYGAWIESGMAVSDERVSDIAGRMLCAYLDEFSVSEHGVRAASPKSDRR